MQYEFGRWTVKSVRWSARADERPGSVGRSAVRRVLIANRGEIALRAVHACRKLGLESVAVYSTADANSPHRWAADHAVCIGPPAPKASYLNAAALIETAVASKCDAIYPGYGFLAENSSFAERCAESDLTSSARAVNALLAWATKSRHGRRLPQSASRVYRALKAGSPTSPPLRRLREISDIHCF